MGAFSEATGVESVRIARIAGQYGKPRSKPTEMHPELGEIMSFKGDNINGYEPTERKWDPQRLLTGYWHSSATLNYLRSLQQAEDFGAQMLGDLDVSFLKSSPQFAAYSKVAAAAKEQCDAIAPGVFTAHEAMQLDLEEALRGRCRARATTTSPRTWSGSATARAS